MVYWSFASSWAKPLFFSSCRERKFQVLPMFMLTLSYFLEDNLQHWFWERFFCGNTPYTANGILQHSESKPDDYHESTAFYLWYLFCKQPKPLLNPQELSPQTLPLQYFDNHASDPSRAIPVNYLHHPPPQGTLPQQNPSNQAADLSSDVTKHLEKSLTGDDELLRNTVQIDKKF